MAEVVGFASALLTLAVLALDTSKSLYEAVSRFKSQRKTIKDLQTDLSSLIAVLGSIRTQAQNSQEVERLELLRHPLECCLTTCQDMRDMLDACTKHSTEGRDSVRNWLNMRYHEKGFADMKQRLASYKSTLSITFGSINLRDHSTTQNSFEDLQDSIRGTKEDLEDQLEQVRQIIGAVDVSMRESLQADQARLQRCLDSLERAQGIANITRPQVTVRNNRTKQGSRAVFGTDASQPQFSLNVSDNDVGLGAIAAAGVHTPQTLQALLRDSRTPDLALALQAHQTQSQRAHGSALPSILHNLSVGSSEVNECVTSRGSENTNPLNRIDAPPRSVDPVNEEVIQSDKAHR